MAEAIVISGIKETIDALKQFDKDAARRLNKLINDELLQAQGDARELIPEKPPLSGWRTTAAKNPKKGVRGGEGWPAWEPQAIRQGVVKTRTQGRVRADYTTSAGALLQKTAAGAIFEVAGRRTAGEGRGRQMIGVLNTRFNGASRAIWKVVDRDKPKILTNVQKAMNEAQRTLQAKFDTEKG